MNITNILKLIGFGLVIFTIGVGLGFYYAPDVVKEISHSDKKTDEDSETTETEKYDPNTGKIIEKSKTTKKSKTTEKSKDSSKEAIKTRKNYAVKGGVAFDPRDNAKMIPRVGVEMRLPIFDSWIGVEGDINLAHPIVGAYGRLEF